MQPEQFDMLLQIVGPHIKRSHHAVREPISSTMRLALTLRFLASGDSMISISYTFPIGQSTVSGIIAETCQAIWSVLKDKVLLQPSTENWLEIAKDFYNKWNFPNCIGAIDGKHVVVQARPHSGSTFYNYKGDDSLIPLAMCDANYCFTLVDIGAEGRQSDGGVFRNSSIGQAFENQTLFLPSPAKISPDREPLPHVMVADEAFSVTTYMLRPYPRASLNPLRRIFNYRLSRARRVNAFGIMVARWRIFRKPILCSTETVEGIIKACVCLHNWLMKMEKSCKTRNHLPNFTDCVPAPANSTSLRPLTESLDSAERTDLHPSENNRLSINTSTVRNTLTEFFNNEGAVEWQWERAQNNDF